MIGRSWFPGQVEIGMIGEVHRRRRRRGRLEVDLERVVIAETVGRVRRQFPRIALFAGGAHVAQAQAIA